jgi:predicted HicB family RNase H-like nuclease
MSAETRKNLVLRLPVDLHAELVRRAEEQGVSLNQLLVALLAGAVGFSLQKKKR